MTSYTKTFGVLLAFLLILPLVLGTGCKRQEEPKEQQLVTIDNLQTAYGSAMKRLAWYDLFVKQAEKEHLASLGALFQAVRQSEQVHADMHASLLKSKGFEPRTPLIDSLAPGTSLQYLRGAVSLESQESESMYPALIATAQTEKFDEAVQQFQWAQAADARHLELFKEIFDRGGKIPKSDYSMCTRCGYLFTAEGVKECPVCKATQEKIRKI